MASADGKVRFSDLQWLPDIPALDCPGLTQATNVIYVDGQYRSFPKLAATIGTALASEPLGGIMTDAYTYVGTQTGLLRSGLDLGTFTTYNATTTGYSASSFWDFEQFDDYVIATNGIDVPQFQTVGSVGNFQNLALTGTAPKSRVVGRIGQFLFLGDNTNDSSTLGSSAGYRVQWSAIDNPTDWPTPGSTSANTAQSGEQFLRSELGDVTGIVGGDQFGLIFQENGITRVTYVGGDTVFQFDQIDSSRGCVYPRSIVQIGGKWYYISRSGICVTNGVETQNIGEGRVNHYFWSTVYASGHSDTAGAARLRGAIDPQKSLILWAFPTALASLAPNLLVYNYDADKFTLCQQTTSCLLSYTQATPAYSGTVDYLDNLRAFDSGFAWVRFAATAGTASIATSESELNPGGRALIRGVKSFITGATAVVNASTIAIATRSTSGSASYTAETTANSRSGFSEFRSDARYHRARITITGDFTSVDGLEFDYEPSGEV